MTATDTGTIRDIQARQDHVTDPVTGSELVHDAFDTSKEGGAVYRFLFRTETSA